MNPKYFPLPKTEHDSVVFQKENEKWFYDSLHFHEAYQITLIHSGTGTCFAGNAMHPFAPEDIFLIGNNMPHVFRSDVEFYENNDLRSKASTIFFSPKTISALVQNLPDGEFIQNTLKGIQKGFKLKNKAIAELILRTEGQGNFEKISLLFQILTMIIQQKQILQLSDANFYQGQKEITYERINAVFEYSIQNYKEPISIDQVANLISMTPNAFCKYFKKRTRKTYISFLNDVRINNACQLLQNPDAIIADVAVACGFNNFANFNRQFQKRIGLTPRNYREQQQKIS